MQDCGISIVLTMKSEDTTILYYKPSLEVASGISVKKNKVYLLRM